MYSQVTSRVGTSHTSRAETAIVHRSLPARRIRQCVQVMPALQLPSSWTRTTNYYQQHAHGAVTGARATKTPNSVAINAVL